MNIKLGFEVGAYMLHKMGGKGDGTLVHIGSIEETKEGKKWAYIDYVQVCTDGRVIGGGSSGSWGENEFFPIISPIHFLAAQVAECQKRGKEAEYNARKAKEEESILLAAMDALKSAQTIMTQATA